MPPSSVIDVGSAPRALFQKDVRSTRMRSPKCGLCSPTRREGVIC